MIVRTKYKRFQFILEWITFGLALLWFVAALILLYNFCDEQTEILKRNLIMLSIIFDILAYIGLTTISLLPHNNALIKSERYEKADIKYQYERESALRTAALIIKLILILAIIFMGIYKYIF